MNIKFIDQSCGAGFDEVDDLCLIEMVRKGDIDAFSVLVKRYELPVRACLRARMCDKTEAEDLAQESFIIAFKKINEFEESSSFCSWVKGIAINLLKNYMRKHQPLSVGGQAELERMIDEALLASEAIPDESVLISALEKCIGKLNDSMKTLLLEHYRDGFSLVELRKKYEVQHSTITMRLFRIRQRLKECIEKSIGEFQ